MDNLFESQDARDFFVWVDPNFFLADWNLNKIGSLFSIPSEQDSDNLMFMPNPKFSGFVSPFQASLLWNYKAEYNLELSRRTYFQNYPSRLTAVFLFETKAEADKYAKTNKAHVAGRELKHVKTIGAYKFSRHDSIWVDFLRTWGMKDSNTINSVCGCYWRGITLEQCELSAFGKSYIESPIFEVLFLGRVDLIREE